MATRMSRSISAMVVGLVGVLWLLSGVGAFSSAVPLGPDFLQQGRLLPERDDGAALFGHSMALSGDTLLIGAVGDSDHGDNSGSATIFLRSGETWRRQATLVASDSAAGDILGYSVALSGDSALVGAAGDNEKGTSSGSAYVFTRSGRAWKKQTKLVAPDGAAGDQLGYSVALSGDTALAGAFFDDDWGESSGSAYVFVRSGSSWSQQAKLVAPDAAAGDQFGRSVALVGDTAFVGAPRDDEKGESTGAVYVFVRSGESWTPQAKLVPDDAAAGDQFGHSLALSGQRALIGARDDDDKGENSGSAYVFEASRNTWSQQAKLVASDGAPGDIFGYSAALSGDTALVGALSDDDKGESAGAAYLFRRSGEAWSEQPKLLASDGAPGDQFGSSVAISEDTALVGAVMSKGAGSGPGAGAAYVFAPQPLAVESPPSSRDGSDSSAPGPGQRSAQRASGGAPVLLMSGLGAVVILAAAASLRSRRRRASRLGRDS